MNTPGQNPSNDIITRWPVSIGVDYDQAALMCDAWVPHYRNESWLVRCGASIQGWSLEEISGQLGMHIRNVRHVPPPAPYDQNWNGYGVWDPQEDA